MCINSETMKLLILATFSLLPLAPAVFAQTATASPELKLDFGDYSSSTLTGKAWAAQGKGDHASALGYAGKCIEMFGDKAKEMQATLQEPAPKDKAFEFWALNDVGTCYFITGQTKEKMGDKEGAIAAYKVLTNDLKFAQCWDPKGWFWQPAGAAQGRLKVLEFEAMSGN